MTASSVCRSKKRFETMADGMKSLNRLNKKKRGKRNVYRCQICDGFHLTSIGNKTTIRRRIIKMAVKKGIRDQAKEFRT